MTLSTNPVFCALDTTDLDQAVHWARALNGHVGGLKIGMEFFYSHGRRGYDAVAREGVPIFLDLKLHDIPNTVAGGLRALMNLDPLPALVTVHCGGGLPMMRAAAEAANGKVKIVGVTILTSLSGADLVEIGFTGDKDTADHARALAHIAQIAGLDGVVCSPHDVAGIKHATSADFLTVVPGIRPAGVDAGDQKRIATPGETIKQGADILVVGRAITKADDPAAAAQAIVAEVAEVEAARD
ncbi:MAG: orotidine-5'-phosphate decarboxylase [Hyphomicrobiales bacterium]